MMSQFPEPSSALLVSSQGFSPSNPYTLVLRVSWFGRLSLSDLFALSQKVHKRDEKSELLGEMPKVESARIRPWDVSP